MLNLENSLQFFIYDNENYLEKKENQPFVLPLNPKPDHIGNNILPIV